MPNARILYVSATGATESANLGYMQRLGLWGPGTAFQTRDDFVRLLNQRGVGVPYMLLMSLSSIGPCPSRIR